MDFLSHCGCRLRGRSCPKRRGVLSSWAPGGVLMKCANCLCNAESLYFRSGSLHAVDCIATEEQVEGKAILRQKVIWLCENCSNLFTIDTWRPPGQQLHAHKLVLRIVSRRQGSIGVGTETESVKRDDFLSSDSLIRSKAAIG